MIHTRKNKIKYQCLNNSTLIDIILDKEDKIKSLETILRHIEQYFDDLDDIDYKTIKYEVENILKGELKYV